MKREFGTKMAVFGFAVALCVALSGCAPGASTSGTEVQQANRAYMSQVNETMVELGDELQAFVDAVSRDDVVNMRTQADNAYKTLDKLDDLKAPDDLADIKTDYVDGAKKLREALDAYIELYTSSSKAEDGVETEEFNARIAEIQKLYDEGVALMQKGDATAAGSAAAPSPDETDTSGSAAAQSSDATASSEMAAPSSGSAA